MEKKIVIYSYWLGIVCLVVSVIWKAADTFGFGASLAGLAISYMTFFKGALLLLLTTVATGAYQAANRP